MRLATFEGGFGRVEGERVVPMGADLVTYLATGRSADGPAVRLGDVRLLAPVPRPGKVIGIGLNYRDHAAESGQPIPEAPILFPKFANSVVGPGAPIVIPPETEQPDYEAELGVVIGRTASRVSTADALSYVAGYTCVNDVSARDLQFQSSQWMLGKAIDTFLPCGPWIVTTDEIPDPQVLAVRLTLNGEELQHSSTGQMVFGVAELIAFVSRTTSLEPGDLIATGTPPGVGFAREPPIWLRDGDVVSVEIEGIGTLTNPVRTLG
ncbi:MAG TPA: fumarylacetoacetate hydrolase family protein [Actinomycetota bacterium]|nr:fumarylacetoacetate hydrolase family protein [Actinomycetota bacterium]